jgi:hypothetical protein
MFVGLNLECALRVLIVRAFEGCFVLYVINQHLHIYKYVQGHNIIILHKHVSATPVTITRVSYSKNATNIQIFVQKYMIQPLGVTFGFL